MSKADKEAHELLPGTHRVFSLLHRVLLGTYQGAISHKHLPSYLSEYEFRFNRRKSQSRSLLFQRLLSAVVNCLPAFYWQIVGRPDAATPLRAAAFVPRSALSLNPHPETVRSAPVKTPPLRVNHRSGEYRREDVRSE